MKGNPSRRFRLCRDGAQHCCAPTGRTAVRFGNVRCMLVVLAARRAVWRLSRLSRLLLARLFGVVAALFAASDAPVGPQALAYHSGGTGYGSGVFEMDDAEAADVLHQALDFRELLAALGGRGQLGELQLATELEPLNDRLKICFGEMLAEDAADGGANELAGDGVRAL